MDSPVIICQNSNISYVNKKDCFRPNIVYPEYLFKKDISETENAVYDLVRNAFILTGYDKVHYGTKRWNPLKNYIKEGYTVVIKPNLVMHENKSGGGTECLYTQPAVVAAVIDYVLIALKGTGKVILGDAPMQECDFKKLVQESGYNLLIDYYQKKGVKIELVDFRGLSSSVINGVYHSTINDTAYGKVIDLALDSEFAEYNKTQIKNLRITNYDPTILNSHHTIDKHEYFISQYILDADFIINMPKPKTHRKAGVTISLKNMVGVSVRKEYLPHHCLGNISDGGDEYLKKSNMRKISAKLLDLMNIYSACGKYRRAKICKLLSKVFRRLSSIDNNYFEGSWYGNQTISKTIIDLNKIIMYCDQKGNLQREHQKKMLIIGDLIISGEKEGPVLPSPKNVGIIAIGENPVCFDEAIATVMGMDIKKIPVMQQARKVKNQRRLVETDEKALIISNNSDWDNHYIDEIDAKTTLHFIPSSGWEEHIEL